MSASPARKPRILHLHSTFSAGGKELRSVRLSEAFGAGVEHAIVSAEPGKLDAGKLISPSIKITYPQDFPSLEGSPTPARLLRLARAMQGYDLVLTYNWGAMDAVMAHTLFMDVVAQPALIHHEDGFNEDERDKLKPTRNWYRRIALGRTAGLVVPSERLEETALVDWHQPLGRVKRIANGIDVRAFARKPKSDALRGVIKHKGEFWVGTLAGLRKVKNLPRLVRAFARLPEDWQLVIVGDGEERAAIREEAEKLGVNHRLHLPGFAAEPARFVGLFDIFALSSDSEQFPVSVLEAMAAGLPVAAPAVGDIETMVSDENARFVTRPSDEDALASALSELAADPLARKRIGEANRVKALAQFDAARMIDSYRRLYASAMGRKTLP